jgi:hypothetical protein
MSKLGINTGSVANDGTGDTLRAGAIKINSNFDEIYNSLGDGSNILVGFGKTVISIDSSSYKVGIGSTIPRERLDIDGNVYVSGIITAFKLLSNLEGNVYSAGIVTSSAYYIGTDQVISSGRELKNILSLDNITLSTIENAIKSDPNDFDTLNVSGITSLGFSAPTGGVVVGKGSTSLIVNGSLLVENISRFLNNVTLTENLEIQKNLNILGIVTATTFFGQVNSGIVTSNIASIGSLTVSGSSILQGFYSSGISTISVTGNGNAFVVDDNTNPGITPFVVGAGGSVGIKTSRAHYSLQVGSAYTKAISTKISGALRADKVIGIHTISIPTGNYGGLSPTIDAFGIPTDMIFDCLYEPAGQIYPVDYGTLS